MRNFAASMLAFAVLLIGIRYMAFPGYEKQAVTRVKNMLTGMQEGGGTGMKSQTAMAMWARNTFTISDNQELSWASDHFDKWRKQKGLYRKFQGFEILDSEMVDENEEKPVAKVRFKIEEKEYAVNVPKGRPIEWAE